MLRVNVELHDAQTGEHRLLTWVDIVNTGLHPQHPVMGEYRVMLCTFEGVQEIAYVTDYPRTELDAISLAWAALTAIGVECERPTTDGGSKP